MRAEAVQVEQLASQAFAHGVAQTSPTEPVEGLTPASLQRLLKASEVHRKPRTLFRLSSGDAGGVDLLMALHDEGDDLTGEVTFGAAGAELGMPIGNAPGDELPRPLISPQPTDRDDMRGAIGAAVAAAVQAMRDCLAGGCRNGTDTANAATLAFERMHSGLSPAPRQVCHARRIGLTRRP